LFFFGINVGPTPVTDGAEAFPRNKTKDKCKKTKVEEKLDKNKKIKVVGKKNDLRERLFEFAEMVREFLETIPSSPEYRTIVTHLSKSAGSLSDCNKDERSVSTYTTFRHNPGVSLRHLRESDCWLRIAKRNVKEINAADLEYLLNESAELKSMLDAINQKSQ
jgi:four helix bundle protein